MGYPTRIGNISQTLEQLPKNTDFSKIRNNEVFWCLLSYTTIFLGYTIWNFSDINNKTARIHWTDPRNWKQSIQIDPIPHLERIPCAWDVVQIRNESNTFILLPDKPITIRNLRFIGENGLSVRKVPLFLVLSFIICTRCIYSIINNAYSDLSLSKDSSLWRLQMKRSSNTLSWKAATILPN